MRRVFFFKPDISCLHPGVWLGTNLMSGKLGHLRLIITSTGGVAILLVTTQWPDLWVFSRKKGSQRQDRILKINIWLGTASKDRGKFGWEIICCGEKNPNHNYKQTSFFQLQFGPSPYQKILDTPPASFARNRKKASAVMSYWACNKPCDNMWN